MVVKHLLAPRWDSGSGLEILVAIARMLPNNRGVLFLPRKQTRLAHQIDIDPKVVLGVRIVNVTQQLAKTIAIGDEVELLVRKVRMQRINRSKEGQHGRVITHL